MARTRVVAGAWIREGRVLAAERGPGRSDAGRWELPGGKVEPTESDAEALVRELREELGITATVVGPMGVGVTDRIELVAYVITAPEEPVFTEHTTFAWLGLDELGSVPWADADVPLLAPLADRIRSATGP